MSRDFLLSAVLKETGFNWRGLVRSAGGWAAYRRQGPERIHLKGDERILGDSGFVKSVLEKAQEEMQRRYRLRAEGFDFAKVVKRVSELLNIDSKQILLSGKQPSLTGSSLLAFYLLTGIKPLTR